MLFLDYHKLNENNIKKQIKSNWSCSVIQPISNCTITQSASHALLGSGHDLTLSQSTGTSFL